MGREEEERLGSRVSGFSNFHGVWLYYERCSGSKMPTPSGRASETRWSLLRYELQRLLFCLQVYSFKGYWAKLSSNLEYIKYTKPHLHYHNSVVRREWHNLVSEEVSTQLALETEASTRLAPAGCALPVTRLRCLMAAQWAARTASAVCSLGKKLE